MLFLIYLLGFFAEGFIIVILPPRRSAIRKQYAASAPLVPIGIILFSILLLRRTKLFRTRSSSELY